MKFSELIKSIATDDLGRLDFLLSFMEQNTNVVLTPEMLQEFIDSKKMLPAKFEMNFETDWDFSIKFKDKLYSQDEFTIRLSSVDELDEIEVFGPFGDLLHRSNIWVVDEAVRVIKANPNEHFSNLGGNRGVEWVPLGAYNET
jgi:hypothetical protein